MLHFFQYQLKFLYMQAFSFQCVTDDRCVFSYSFQCLKYRDEIDIPIVATVRIPFLVSTIGLNVTHADVNETIHTVFLHVVCKMLVTIIVSGYKYADVNGEINTFT